MIKEINKITSKDIDFIEDMSNQNQKIRDLGIIYISEELSEKLECYPDKTYSDRPYVLFEIDENKQIEIKMFVGTNTVCAIDKYVSKDVVDVFKSKIKEIIKQKSSCYGAGSEACLKYCKNCNK